MRVNFNSSSFGSLLLYAVIIIIIIVVIILSRCDSGSPPPHPLDRTALIGWSGQEKVREQWCSIKTGEAIRQQEAFQLPISFGRAFSLALTESASTARHLLERQRNQVGRRLRNAGQDQHRPSGAGRELLIGRYSFAVGIIHNAAKRARETQEDGHL